MILLRMYGKDKILVKIEERITKAKNLWNLVFSIMIESIVVIQFNSYQIIIQIEN